MTTIKQEMHECLTNNILHFWLDRMVDNEQGGFYGRIDGNDHVVADSEKGAILNARILWAFAIWMLRYVPRNTSSTTS